MVAHVPSGAEESVVWSRLDGSRGEMLVGTAAKLLGWGEHRLFAFLRARRVLMDSARYGKASHNVPYQSHLDAGRFRVRLQTWRDSTGVSHIAYTTYVTPKGLSYIARLLERERVTDARKTIEGA